MSFLLVYVTYESEEDAKRITDTVISEKLAACTNIFPIQSAYWWQQDIHRDAEWVSLLKTTISSWEPLKSRIEDLHPYEIPCIIKLEVAANSAYEEWIAASVNQS